MAIKDLMLTDPWTWPKDAAEDVQKALDERNRTASDRLGAAGMAGEITLVNDRLCASLLRIVGDAAESQEMRATAAISLGPVLEECDTFEFDEPLHDSPISRETYEKIRETLHTYFSGRSFPKEVRRRILEASARAPMDWHTEAIRTAFGSRDSEWVLTAVFCMRWVQGFQSEILAALKSPAADVQYEALEAAANWEIAEAWQYAVRAFQNPKNESRIRAAAILAAGYARPEQTVPLLEPFMDSEDEEIEDAVNDVMALYEANRQGPEFDDDEDEDKPNGTWVN